MYDLLLQYNLHIVGEKSISISHCLMALDGVSKSEITRVLSHPQALAQCDQYLRNMQVVKEAVDDTAGQAPQTPSCSHLRSCAGRFTNRNYSRQQVEFWWMLQKSIAFSTDSVQVLPN